MPTPQTITSDDRAQFDRDGFVVKRAFFSPTEMAVLARSFAEDDALRSFAESADDGRGSSTQIVQWNEPGDDAFGAFARSERMVNAVTAFLGAEVYHYHSKITLKPPQSGGTWRWHQDYGYWYDYGCLAPTMLTVAVPLSAMTEETGAPEVLRGSHSLGRLDHVATGDQAGADPERLAVITERYESVVFTAEPGDVMFFHCNTLHTSQPNRSATQRRDLFLIAYNTAGNSPFTRDQHHAHYAPIEALPDSALATPPSGPLGKRREFVFDPAPG